MWKGADNDPEKRLEDMEARCFKYLRQVINRTQPDLILIAGDVIYGQFDDSGEALKELVKFFDGYRKRQLWSQPRWRRRLGQRWCHLQ